MGIGPIYDMIATTYRMLMKEFKVSDCIQYTTVYTSECMCTVSALYMERSRYICTEHVIKV